MLINGSQLRQARENAKLAQARLAELTKIPQHLLSGFELEKIDLPKEQIDKILEVLSDLSRHSDVVHRKKRYRTHTFERRPQDSMRAALASKSAGNDDYLNELRGLSIEAKKGFTGVSLFAGCGGLSLGFRSAGCDIKGFVEIDDGLARIYSENFPGVKKIGTDISTIGSEQIKEFAAANPPIDVIIGGPPCQGFSLSGKRDIHDPRNYLFQEYMRFIDILRPKVAIIENVRLLTSMKSKTGGLVRDEIISDFATHGYEAQIYEVNACDYGVPQHRERVFFVAVRSDVGAHPSFPNKTFGSTSDLFSQQKRIRTFADACSDLPYIESGESSNDPLHCAVSHPDHVIEWLWNVPQGASAHDNEDPTLRPPSGYNTTYKRQVWDEPAATVQTTFGMISGCRNVHPIATRSLTIREASRLQSFPDSYRFIGTQGVIRTGIGNAVPPLLAKAIADHMRTRVLNFVEVPSF
ncbi:DNA (cytosine-5-)-methyltransferase [Ferrovibrio sp.]|uniref:DNA (cytosine-5-)-methyltransferase n=1 Tax=Ferrovibrio sp. TaxID=1917215 RepID=UPI001B529672|nr:DNA (cytosine-5-)-methyltransferase [Ferrovibrio sp.]MBP7065498.1 DNA (cytosine-5-)-methyltransferase [Ferrovibrio sp.]